MTILINYCPLKVAKKVQKVKKTIYKYEFYDGLMDFYNKNYVKIIVRF